MSAFPNSPRVIKGGLILVDSAGFAVRRVIEPQHHPERRTRTLPVRSVGEGGGGTANTQEFEGGQK
jgi:hypothetical protein